MGARETALCALIACRKNGAWVNTALKDYCARDALTPRDAALAARLCYGVVQNRGKLDFYLKQLLTKKLSTLHPVARDVLHLGIYQLYEMDKIPESAAVNESVALAKKYCPNPQIASLVNAVLRNAARKQGQLQEPISYADKYSHPDELITLLKQNLPKGTLEMVLKADNMAVSTTVQTNTIKITTDALMLQLKEEGVFASKHAWMDDCLILSGGGSIDGLKSFQDGLFYVQDAAPKLSVYGLPIGNLQVLDCCSAPGGKTFAMAIAMEGKGSFISCDVHPHKISLIENGAKRLGLANVTAKLQDATKFVPEWENAMDIVVADVPCSGLGIIRKKPDIRYKALDEMEQLPQLQKEILWNVSRYVKPGGTLVYSTCTLLKRENEAIAEAFLESHPEFEIERLVYPKDFPGERSDLLTLLSGQYDTDGFFISRFRRKV